MGNFQFAGIFFSLSTYLFSHLTLHEFILVFPTTVFFPCTSHLLCFSLSMTSDHRPLPPPTPFQLKKSSPVSLFLRVSIRGESQCGRFSGSAKKRLLFFNWIQWNPASTICQGSVKIISLNRDIVTAEFRYNDIAHGKILKNIIIPAQR